MERKYELLTDDTIMVSGHKLFRICASISFNNIEAGEKGGYIESEKNLAHEGDAWISGNAQVSGNAHVTGNARIYGNAQVSGNARISGNAQVSGNAQIDGDTCVFGETRVFGNAQVSGNAQIYGNAQINGNAQIDGNAQINGGACVSSDTHYLCISPIGSRNDAITFARTKEHKIAVAVGCFRGDIDQFEAQVKATHGENEHAKTYMLAAQLARTRIDLS